MLFRSASVTGDIRITAAAVENGYTAYDAIMANSNYTYNSDNSIFFPDYVGNGDVASIDELQIEFELQPQKSDSGNACLIGAKDTGGSGNTNGLEIMFSGSSVFVYAHGVNGWNDTNISVSVGQKYVIKYATNGISPSTFSVDATNKSLAWSNSYANVSPLGLSFCGLPSKGGEAWAKNSRVKIGYVKIWDKNGTLLNHFVPAKRNSDSRVGMYDENTDEFITAGSANGRYALSSWTVVS